MLNDNKSIFGNFSKDLLRINFQISKSFRQFHLPPPLFGQRTNCNCSRSLSTLLLLASHLPTIHGRQCTFLSRVNFSHLLGNDFLFLKSFFHRSKLLANHLWFPSPMVITSQASVQISTVLLTYHPFFLCLNFFSNIASLPTILVLPPALVPPPSYSQLTPWHPILQQELDYTHSLTPVRNQIRDSVKKHFRHWGRSGLHRNQIRFLPLLAILLDRYYDNYLCVQRSDKKAFSLLLPFST